MRREKLLEILAWIGFRTFLHQEQGLFEDSYEALPESLAHDSRSDRPWESYVSFNVLTLNSTCKWLSIWMAPGAQSMSLFHLWQTVASGFRACTG